MKLARCSDGGPPFWAAVEGDRVRPFGGALADWAPRLTAGEGPSELAFTGESRPLGEVRLLPPIERGSTVMVAGANYTRHLVEFGIAAPSQPFAFMKPYGALIGAGDDIIRSPLTEKLDYEVELVAIVGAPIDRGDPMRSVLGFTVGNDVSARDLQTGPPGIGMDLLSAKGLDRTTGLGPWIVTRDEFGDSAPDLRLTLKVNGETRQDGRTSAMTWNVGELAAYIDVRSALQAGDVIFTGTPEGVAQASGRFLQIGDLVEAEIEQIGALRNRVAAPWPKGSGPERRLLSGT
jgi:2-keto-4-pentenoate hydratase/2-oxohepta-3-ene-1,7-dioic acid hydratase in catechol pathway